MAISKPGIASLVIGIIIVALTAYFGFPGAGIFTILLNTLLGGLILLGLFLVLIGVLMLII